MGPITMSRYTEAQLNKAIIDNINRGYYVVKTWDHPKLDKDGLVRYKKYYARMMKV
ncbi:hypothetical protein [Paenibacillus chitinolyticus]|uniref:hypothetical protein n=1 Tax=Paenibacillus chitinolyticus TaxID=79263 RepID=UPI00366B017E